MATTDQHEAQVIKLAPSDLTFLYEDCERCFYLKVMAGIRRPGGPMPKVFTKMDQLQRDFFDGKPTSAIEPALGVGVVRCSNTSVRSAPIVVPGCRLKVRFGGSLDALIAFEDGSVGVVDFKTSSPRGEHVSFYSRQLHAYALALENPLRGNQRGPRVSRLGLLCFDPLDMTEVGEGRYAFVTQPTFLDVPRDDRSFLKFLSGAVALLEHSTAPDPDPDCDFCVPASHDLAAMHSDLASTAIDLTSRDDGGRVVGVSEQAPTRRWPERLLGVDITMDPGDGW